MQFRGLYLAKGTLDPWLGYWIKAKKACDLIVPAP
jgi:hypothetical protein